MRDCGHAAKLFISPQKLARRRRAHQPRVPRDADPPLAPRHSLDAACAASGRCPLACGSVAASVRPAVDVRGGPAAARAPFASPSWSRPVY